jgi:hypothetical protein
MIESHERLARQAALGAGIPDWWDTLDGETLAELRADAALLAKRRDDFLAGRPTDVPPGPTPAEIEAARGELHAALRAEQEAEERQARRKQEFETRKRELETRKRELETKLARSGERIVRLSALYRARLAERPSADVRPVARTREHASRSRRASSASSDDGPSDQADEPPLARPDRALRPAPELQVTILLEGEARLRIAALSYEDQERLLVYLATSDALVDAAVALLDLADRLLDEAAA